MRARPLVDSHCVSDTKEVPSLASTALGKIATRQTPTSCTTVVAIAAAVVLVAGTETAVGPVSYTHLTLPTKRIV